MIDPTTHRTMSERSYHGATSRSTQRNETLEKVPTCFSLLVKQGLLYSVIGRKEGRTFLFKDALDIFYLRLYGIRDLVKDHSDSQRGNLLPPLRGLHFSISSKGSFICTIPQTGLVTSVIKQWLERRKCFI